MTHIVVWTDKAGNDHWTAFIDEEASARRLYAKLKTDALAFTVSLCTVVESTDYPTKKGQ